MSNVLCPSCDGGRTREKSLYVWDSSGVTYGKCYRASCGWSGRVDGLLTVSNPAPKPRSKGEPLCSTQREYLIGRVGVGAFNRLGAFSVGSRVGLPIYSPLGSQVGLVRRSFTGDTPKALTELDDSYELKSSWYNNGPRIVLVEDQLSAACCAAYSEFTGVALLGCTLSPQLANHLAGRDVSICLDQDATRVAVGLSLRWRGVLDLRVVPLRGPDLKDRGGDLSCLEK